MTLRRSFKNWLLPGILSLGLLLVGWGHPTTNAGPGNQVQETTQKKNTNISSISTGVPSGNSGKTGMNIQQPSSIAFWNKQQGLLVSESNGQGLVWKTIDGGHSWTKVYENANLLGRVVLTGGTSAKVLVGADWTNPTSQIVTADKGKTWKKQAYKKPSFADKACSAGKFGEKLFVNHSAPSSSKMWALCVGQPGAGQMPKMIVSSTNGGKTWTKQAEVNPYGTSRDGLGVSGYPQGIDFLSNGRGWLWETRGYSFYTIDGGKHWTPFTNLTSPESKEARSMSLIDNQHGYALLWDNNQYRLMFTKDGGKSWDKVKSWVNQ